MKALKSVAALAALLASSLSSAHPGHGLEGAAHDLVHLVWLLNGAVLLSVGLVFVLGRTKGRR